MSVPLSPAKDPRQAEYAAFRRAWRAGLERWIAAGRPDQMEVRSA